MIIMIEVSHIYNTSLNQFLPILVFCLFDRTLDTNKRIRSIENSLANLINLNLNKWSLYKWNITACYK